MTKPFVTYHANKKNNKTYYALLRGVSVFGSYDNYIVYQSKEGQLYAREKSEFDIKFRQLSPDDRSSIPSRNIRELTETVIKGAEDKSVFANAYDNLVIISERVIDATNKYSDRERMLILFYDITTETFWLGETITPRISLRSGGARLTTGLYKDTADGGVAGKPMIAKASVLKYIVLEDLESLPVFVKPRKCNHILGKIKRLNDRETLIYDSIEYKLNVLDIVNKEPTELALRVFEQRKNSQVCAYEFYAKCPACGEPIVVEHDIRIVQESASLIDYLEHTDEFLKNGHLVWTEQKLRAWNRLYYMIDRVSIAEQEEVA